MSKKEEPSLLTLELHSIFPTEFDQLQKELTRIKDKYYSKKTPCDFILNKKVNKNNEVTPVLKTNKYMIEAYISEQIL